MSDSFDAISVGFIFGFALAAPLFTGIAQHNLKQPEILESMLCEKHVPTGTMLVTDSYIKSNGKIYKVIE